MVSQMTLNALLSTRKCLLNLLVFLIGLSCIRPLQAVNDEELENFEDVMQQALPVPVGAFMTASPKPPG